MTLIYLIPLDNIKKWTGMDFASSTRAAEDRTRWKGIALSHLWCLNDRYGTD